MLAKTKQNGGLVLAIRLRRKFIPEDSIRDRLYCRFIQPWIRVAIEATFLAQTTLKESKDKYTGIATIAGLQMQEDRNSIQKILIIKPDHIGDFVLGLPAYRTLREAFPSAEITLLCGTWNKVLAEQSGLFDQVKCLNLFHEASGKCKTGIAFDKAAFEALDLKDFDIAVDFRDSGETRFLLDHVGTRFRAGFAAAGQERHMDLAFPSTSFRLNDGHRAHHQTVQSLLAASVISFVTDARAMSAVLDKIAATSSAAESYHVSECGSVIGINIGSGDEAKNWPWARFKEIAKRLIDECNATIILFGSKMQEEGSRLLAQALPEGRVINKAGSLSISQSMAAMRKLDLYIGNDTGTTHIAAGLDVPTICLFSNLTTHESHGAIGKRCLSILADRKYGIGSIQCHHVMGAIFKMLGNKAPQEKSRDGWMNFIVIDNKPYNNDFRKYLLRAAAQDHANALHIECGADTKVTFDEKLLDHYDPDENSALVAADIKTFLGQRRTLILVGLGLGAKALLLAKSLKNAFPDSIAVYDVFDYFRYDAKGYALIVHTLLDLASRAICNRSLLLDESLSWLYPGAAHLDNASHLVKPSQPETPRSDRLVYIGSIDCRVDFEWFDVLMALGVGLDIYGKVHKGDVQIGRELEAFLERNKNAVFYGAYDNDGLPDILNKYKIGLVPYHVNDPMTDHINPDKVYHYLNAGLEVIATPIPQCRRLEPYLHLSMQKNDISQALDAARNQLRNPSWPAHQYTWQQRWRDILAIAAIQHLTPARNDREYI